MAALNGQEGGRAALIDSLAQHTASDNWQERNMRMNLRGGMGVMDNSLASILPDGSARAAGVVAGVTAAAAAVSSVFTAPSENGVYNNERSQGRPERGHRPSYTMTDSHTNRAMMARRNEAQMDYQWSQMSERRTGISAQAARPTTSSSW